MPLGQSARECCGLDRLRIAFATLLVALMVSVPAMSLGDSARTIPFVFNAMDGKTIRLADYKGKWVLVHFWAHWCPLCWAEMPGLNRLNERPDFVVIGISLDYGKRQDKVKAAIADHGLAFEAHVLGGARTDETAAYRQVGPVDFFPTSYLYAPDGEIALFLPGQLNFKKVLAYADNWRFTLAAASRPGLAMDTKKFKAALEKQGIGGKQAFAAWEEMAGILSTASESERLQQVNLFFNKRIQRGKDRDVWKREEYWASPAETLGKGRGDSVDIAIAKYFTLGALGIPPEQLRLVYVKQRGPRAYQADPVQMVLAYYPSPSGEPLLLDDGVSIMKAWQRKDLKPVFSFNSQDVWGDTTGEFAGSGSGSGSGSLPVWQQTLKRARSEGFNK